MENNTSTFILNLFKCHAGVVIHFTTHVSVEDEMTPRQKKKIRPPVHWKYSFTVSCKACDLEEARAKITNSAQKVVSILRHNFGVDGRVRTIPELHGSLSCDNVWQNYLVTEAFSPSRVFSGISFDKVLVDEVIVHDYDYLTASPETCQKELTLQEYEDLKFAVALDRADREAEKLRYLWDTILPGDEDTDLGDEDTNTHDDNPATHSEGGNTST